ncbi:hypothetical protein [Candidatus Poriferisodalis sp.]|uniref:hypothetical protein n=1 Tax=Candidatus Poriferisodalis sp. TaxID=3101277 RepID=UPI003B5C0F5B
MPIMPSSPVYALRSGMSVVLDAAGLAARLQDLHAVSDSASSDPAAALPAEPPAKPSGLFATASYDSVTLTWDDPDDDSITGYVILRRIPGVDPEGHFDELVANTATTAATFTDDTVSAETRYTYRKLAPVVDGYVPTENGEQIYYRDGEPVTSNVDNSYLAMRMIAASTDAFYIRNCAAEPMDGYVSVTTYRDDDVSHLSLIRITQPSPFEITTGPPPA